MPTFEDDDIFKNEPDHPDEPDEQFELWLKNVLKEIEKEDTSPGDIIANVINVILKETSDFLKIVGEFDEKMYNAAVEYMKDSMELIHKKTGHYFLFLTKEGAYDNFVYKKTPFFERSKRFIGQDMDMVEFSKYNIISNLTTLQPSKELKNVPEEIKERMRRLYKALKNHMNTLKKIYEKILNKIIDVKFPVALSDYFMVVSAYDLIKDIDKYKGFSVFFPNPEMPLYIENSGFKYGAIVDDRNFKEGKFVIGIDLPKAFKGTSVELMDMANEQKELTTDFDYAPVTVNVFLIQVLITLAIFIEDRVEHIYDLYPEGSRDNEVKKLLNDCMNYAETIGNNLVQILNDKKGSHETVKPGDAVFVVNTETIEEDILVIDGIYVKII
ncbi:MAG: hypothetical protein N3A54_00155 [Patescibacteria group bacterium]|nr:hypothetical protein [Patescibacteria group bacterium]